MNVSLLKIERIKKGLTQPNLEQLSSIPQLRLSLIERGIAARDDEIKKIASVLKVDADYLFSDGKVKSCET